MVDGDWLVRYYVPSGYKSQSCWTTQAWAERFIHNLLVDNTQHWTVELYSPDGSLVYRVRQK